MKKQKKIICYECGEEIKGYTENMLEHLDDKNYHAICLIKKMDRDIKNDKRN